jgi:Xaa-Pro aminopeptidase
MNRIARLQDWLKEHGKSAYLARHLSDIRYLTGFDHVFDEESAHALLVTLDAAYLHTDNRYLLAMQQKHDPGIALSVEALTHAKWLAGLDLRLGDLLVEDDIPLNFYRALEEALPDCALSAQKDLVLTLRQIKDSEELKALEQAAAISDAAWVELLAWIKPGQSERAIANQLVELMRQHGSEGESFPPIVAAGPNSARVHAIPSDYQVKEGDLLLFDFGAMYADYHADISRTVCLGKANAEQRRLHAAVLAAHNLVKTKIQAGDQCAQVYQLAVDSLAEQGLDKYFTHSLGHGVGLDIHELPNLSPRNSASLELGMVVTDEPGVYVEGVGGVRIEDTGVITADGYRSFATAPRELIEL